MSHWHSFALKTKQGLIAIEKLLSASSLVLLLLFTLSQIIARNFFDTGFPHLDVISRHLVLFITFMGAALVSEQNNHIKIDILSAFLNSRQKEKLARSLLIISTFICAIFSYYSIQFWIDEWNYAPANEQWALFMALIIPVGFIILSMHFFLLLLTGFEHEQIAVKT
ncbi:MAG: TRAP transporter small permease [Gammaproteobacteria bacterium]|nr:TRAP transporter small permease [Gammaproteobacteria bacterium]